MYGLFWNDKRIKLIDLKIPYGSCIVFVACYLGDTAIEKVLLL